MNIDLTAWFGTQIAAILALIAADVLSGVFRAIREGGFDWIKLADFMRTNVVPKLGGWLICAIIARFVAPEFLVGDLAILGPGLEALAFAAVITALGGSIIENLRAIGSIPAQ